jgi:hypothetical protein
MSAGIAMKAERERPLLFLRFHFSGAEAKPSQSRGALFKAVGLSSSYLICSGTKKSPPKEIFASEALAYSKRTNGDQ